MGLKPRRTESEIRVVMEDRSRREADMALHKALEDLYAAVMSNTYLHGSESPATKEAYREFSYANGQEQKFSGLGRDRVCLVDAEVVVELECELL